MTNTTIDSSRPLRDKDNNICFDLEFAQKALYDIDTYNAAHKTPVNLSPKFVEWLREGVDYVKKGQGTFTDYKESHVVKEFAIGGSYDLVIDNTNKNNESLAKKGSFDNKTMQIVKGESTKK